MKFLSIQEAIKKAKGDVLVRGWIYRERKSNKFMFLVLRDSSNIIQCILEKSNVSNKIWEAAKKLLIESSVEITGEIKKERRAPMGYEIKIKGLKVVNYAEKYPITKDQSTEFLADNRHLWIRSRKMISVLKIRSTIFGAIHEFFRKKNYYEFHSPIIIPGGAEEGPTLFEIKYFDQKMYLTQTWQLYAEAAMFALEKIYTIAPSFRAEKSKTSRHLTEYWHAEVEVAWFNLFELLDLAEGLIKYVLTKVLKENKEDLKILGRDIKKLQPSLNKKFPKITYTEALRLLKEKKKINIKWGKDLRTIEEEKLMELFDTPVFVTHYPKEAMAFYKPRDPNNPEIAVCFDMLGPEGHGEIMGGSERDMDLNELIATLKKKGEKIEDYGYYLDTRKYGSIPHAGFGMGVERLVKWICNLENIKDAIGFPRTMARSNP
ncbi:MAG: asparagine--tRNA ligase [Nanoarchaeota archaeon]|nr:asparagine--tRNA ligase [Nanoarchaeota archaeon]